MKAKIILLLACLTLPAYAQKNNTKPEELKPGTIISGIVSDASTGEPIGNALIIETVENDTAAYYYTSTDRDGRFSYPLFGTGHVLKVIANQRVYKRVKIPMLHIQKEVATAASFCMWSMCDLVLIRG